MIIFKLECENRHPFEGWFSDSADYESQMSRGLLTCPTCNSKEVNKVIAGVPFIKQRTEAKVKRPRRAAEKTKSPSATTPIASHLDPVTVLKAVERFVTKNFENVGSRFYDEAVKIHQGEAESRNIYGDATHEQIEKLEEEGIPYTALPKLGPQFEN